MNNEEFKDAVAHRLAEAKTMVKSYESTILDRHRELDELDAILSTWREVVVNYQGVLDDLG